MKPSLAAFFVIATGLLFVAGQASAGVNASAPTTVTVAMHDPGCHWFMVNGAFEKSLSVKGPVSLANLDEATLKIAGPSRTLRDAVGKHIALTAGTYRITMVGQAPHDNTLHLVVK
jgi:hypothetical protein